MLLCALTACSGAVAPASDPAGGLTDTDLLGDTTSDPTPGPLLGVLLNEVLPSNSGVALDEDGDADDLLELYNAGPIPVNLDGWRLEAGGDTYDLPEFTTLAAGAFLVVWCDGDDDGLHAGFKLSQDGDDVRLLDDADAEHDRVGWGDAGELLAPDDDMSLARVPDGAGDWGFAAPTAGGPNRRL